MKKLKILILEDNKLDAELIKEELTEHKFDFTSELVDTEKDFIAAIHDFKPDIILSDYSLLQFTGFEALEIAKELTPDIPFIFVTGSLSEEMAADSMKRGAWDYVIKENLLRLTPAVENALKLKEEKDKKKQAEDALKESEEKFRSVVENSHEGILIVDKDYRFIYVNDELCQILGYPDEEIIGQDFRKFLDEDSKKLVSDRYIRRQRGEDPPSRYEFNVMQKDGKKRQVEISSSIIKNSKGEIFTVAQILDITKRKRAEEKLKESEEKYRLIVENANDGIEITQGDKIIFANQQFTKMLGYKSDEIKNILFSQIHTEQAISDLNDRHKKRKAGMVMPHQYETTFKKKDGTVIDVYIKYEIIDYKQEPATFAVINDITDRKKAEKKLAQYRDHLEELVKKRTKKLKQTQAQLVRKEKLTVLGQLAGSIGHDLRNPLGVISNSVFYLNMKLKDKDEKVKKHLALLKKEIERSENMLSDLLDFSRVKLLNITETNVNTLIKETIEETKIPEYIDLEMDLDEKIPQIPLDPDKMQRVFQNMISNAIQAMSEKGKLHIKTSSNDDFVEIIFSDNGQGIIKKNLKKIFEPLVTTRAKGIGLGLAIVENIIDSHKGKIDVKSEVGKGTTFTIKLRNCEVEKL